MPNRVPELRNQVPPFLETAQRNAPNSATDVKPIEGSIPAGGLRRTLARLLMQTATALGLDGAQTDFDGREAEGEANGTSGPERRTHSLLRQLATPFLESSFFKTIIACGEKFADLVSAAWDYLRGQSTEQIHSQVPRGIPLRDSQHISSNAPAYTQDWKSPLLAPIVDLSPDETKKKVDVFTAAMEQGAEAVRHKKEEDKAERAEDESRDFRERLSHARSIIEAIDARGGTTTNNPRVQAVLASLGTPYDSIQHAIALVEALQAEERKDDPQLQ